MSARQFEFRQCGGGGGTLLLRCEIGAQCAHLSPVGTLSEFNSGRAHF